MNMDSWLPSGKVTAAGIAGATAFLLILAVNQYVPFFINNPIDGPLGSGLPVLAALVASYITSPNHRDVAVVKDEGSQ